MRTLNLTIGATLVLATVSSVPARADHTDVFSCYAYVHDQCFPGGKDGGCGDFYGEALDMCDDYYDDSAQRPKPAASLTVKQNPQLKSKIMRTFSARKK